VSQKFAAEECPNCKGTLHEMRSTLPCSFCTDSSGKPQGVVSHFKLASWKLTHLDELDADALPDTDPAPASQEKPT
jgi:hypothetical protein